MPSIDYNTDIPFASNTPASDQSKMQTNTNSINQWNDVDHYTFAEANAGKHRQLTLAANNAAGTQSGLASTVYSAAGTASSSSSQLLFKNSLGGASAVPYLLSVVKAWAFCNGAAGGIINSQSSNVTSVTRASTGQYTIVMPSNTVASASYAVLITTSNCNSAPTSDACFGTLATDISSPTSTQFVIRTFRQGLTVADPVYFSFMVLQI